MLRHIFSCRAKRAKAGQGGDPSLYFMVLDVVEESGGHFNIMGKTDAEESILVQVHDFEPYFYMGQPVFKADITVLHACISVKVTTQRHGMPAHFTAALIELTPSCLVHLLAYSDCS